MEINLDQKSKTSKRLTLKKKVLTSFSPSYSKNWVRNALGIIITLLILWCIISCFVWAGKWKAVFLDNNQVYFGKFISVPFSSTITLGHVYFLSNSSLSGTSNPASTTSLTVLPLESSIHDPIGTMYISKQHVLYFEVLNPASPLVKAIEIQEKSRK